MKGKVFIAWSGDNHIAHKVKKFLEEKDYKGVVGGQSGTDGSLFVGSAVLAEIDQCNQAIFIVQEKNEKEPISGNIMFELGYALSRFNSNKIHVFYINLEKIKGKIPSDLEGIWSNVLDMSDINDEQETSRIAEKITEAFLEKQKNVVPEEKMSIVNSYYSIKDTVRDYHLLPKCSEYEFAQLVLIFSQAAYMFDDVSSALSELRNLIKRLTNVSEELDYAIRFGVCYLEIFEKVINKEVGRMYLEKGDYRKIKRQLLSLLEKGQTWNKDDFSLWYLALVNDSINYSTILYSYLPDLDTEERIKAMESSIEYGESCLSSCDELAKNNMNRQLVELYRAYMYRNLATAYMGGVGPKEQGIEFLKKSFESRKYLFEYYEMHEINSRLFDNFELEYFLVLSERFEYVEDEEILEDLLDDCADYVKKMKDSEREKNYFIHKIETLLDKATEV